MRWKIFLLCLVFFLSFISIASSVEEKRSSSGTNFTIEGCSYGEKGIAKNSCSPDGLWFCNSTGLFNTTKDVGACTYGISLTDFDKYVHPQCCPRGYYCDGKCKKNLVVCHDIQSKVPCRNNNCYWIDSESRCGYSLNEFSCSIYSGQSECLNDAYNLAKYGSQSLQEQYTGQCGNTSFVVHGHKCQWNNDINVCELVKNITQEIYTGENIDGYVRLQCRSRSQTTPCENYEMTISWTSYLKDIIWGDVTDNAEKNEIKTCLSEICKDETIVVDCGKPLVKVPAFSIVALIFSIIIITAIYHLKIKYL
jgi:hypothetical protein